MRSYSTARCRRGAPSCRSHFRPTGSRARCAMCWTPANERDRLSNMTHLAPSPFGGPRGLDQAQLARLVDQLPVLLWSADEHLNVTSRHGGGLSLLGPPPGPDEGLRVGDGVENPADSALAIRAHERALCGEATTYEVTFRGRTFSARVEPLRESNGQVSGVIGVAFDVTDRRRAEDARRESEARLRTIIESEPECVKLVDTQGRLLDMNPAGLAMIEAESIEAVRGLPVTDVVAPEHREAFKELHRRVFAGESGTLEYEVIGLKGKRSWLATHAVPLRDASGTIQAALGITRDISRRRLEMSRSEEHTSELQSLAYLVCRLLLEKKKNNI